MEIVGIVILVVIVLLVVGVIVAYNSLVRLNERVNEAWSDITVQLKYRADLIPNVIETVKGYAKHEKTTFAMVTEARSAVMGAKPPMLNVPCKALLAKFLPLPKLIQISKLALISRLCKANSKTPKTKSRLHAVFTMPVPRSSTLASKLFQLISSIIFSRTSRIVNTLKLTKPSRPKSTKRLKLNSRLLLSFTE